MGRGSRRSFQIQTKDDITGEAKEIRLRTSGRQYSSGDCTLPRYVKVEPFFSGEINHTLALQCESVLKATKQVNGKGQNLTPRHTKSP